jgi:hypothetical protein
MAIGKPGSVATVEPALVDFGSMTERNIDKIKAEEEAKKQAKAKEEQAKRDAVKDIGIPDKLSFTNISEVDKSLQGTFKREWKRATEAKMGGDDRTLYDAVGTMNTLISYADQIKDTPGKIAERVEKDKTLDEDIVDIYLRDFNSLRENGYQVNTDDPRNMTISLINENGELMNEQPLTEFIETRKVLPRKINLIDETKKVLSTIKPSVSESGSYTLNTKITDINSKESKPQVESIKSNVDLWISNNDFMWSWYKKEMAKDSKLPLKTTKWTQEEKDKAREFYTKTVIDSYNEEVEKGFGSTGGGGGSGPKQTPSIPSIVEPVTTGTVGFNNDVDKLFREGGYSRPVFKGDKGNVKVSGLDLTNVMVNKQGNIVFVLEQPVGSSVGAGGASESNREAGNTYITASDKGFRVAREKVKNYLGIKTDTELASWVSGGELKFNSNNNNNNISEAQQRGL